MKITASIATISALATMAFTMTANAASTGTQNYRLQQIAANASAASSNAHIYQWKRVNTEVDRIDTDEHALEVAGVTGDANLVSNLRQAVLNLRNGRQERNIDKIQAAAADVISAANGLMN
jgi:hypothetical protein